MSESESRADPVSQSSNEEGLEGEDPESEKVEAEEVEKSSENTGRAVGS